MKPDDHHCPALNKSGGPCQRYVKTGASFCWVHDPSKELERERTRRNIVLGHERRRSVHAAAIRGGAR